MEQKDTDTKLKINEHLLKVSAGYIPLESPLISLGQDVVLTVKGSVVKIEIKDNQDGTVDRIYTVKGLYADDISFH